VPHCLRPLPTSLHTACFLKLTESPCYPRSSFLVAHSTGDLLTLIAPVGDSTKPWAACGRRCRRLRGSAADGAQSVLSLPSDVAQEVALVVVVQIKSATVGTWVAPPSSPQALDSTAA
jgi:hypothetical protein